ncbi:hypothetical protein BDF14DRAFT_881716 [Spinellus fusiger]|nr:hypothetical protein BDF14DRAFT_881716 [Spinellus fusiger]
MVESMAAVCSLWICRCSLCILWLSTSVIRRTSILPKLLPKCILFCSRDRSSSSSSPHTYSPGLRLHSCLHSCPARRLLCSKLRSTIILIHCSTPSPTTTTTTTTYQPAALPTTLYVHTQLRDRQRNS